MSDTAESCEKSEEGSTLVESENAGASGPPLTRYGTLYSRDCHSKLEWCRERSHLCARPSLPCALSGLERSTLSLLRNVCSTGVCRVWRRLAEVRRYLGQMYRLDSRELDVVAPGPEPSPDVLVSAAESGHIAGFTSAHPLYEADASNPKCSPFFSYCITNAHSLCCILFLNESFHIYMHYHIMHLIQMNNLLNGSVRLDVMNYYNCSVYEYSFSSNVCSVSTQYFTNCARAHCL